MAGRPRTQSDEDILAGTVRVLSRIGPAKLTLAEVASEVGLSPATLVQRFGSKRGLLLALASEGAAHAGTAFSQALDSVAREGASPLGLLTRVLCDTAREFESPEALAHHLAVLQLDLSDPDFHRHALTYFQAQRAGIQALLEAALEARELAPAPGTRLDTAALARAIQTTVQGSFLSWAVYREGEVVPWLQADLEHLLRPYRASRPVRPRRTPTK